MQREVSQNFNQNVQQANSQIHQHLDDLKDQRDKGEISQTDYDEQVSNWQKGQVLLNAIASGLAAPTQSGAGIAAATASPAISYEIGQYFKDLASQNEDGTLTNSQETAHILAHAVLGAAVSVAGGNDALVGAFSAGGAEAAAPILSQWLYGEKDGSKLTAEQKETVVAITNLLGAGTGVAVGDTLADGVSGSLGAGSAVRNNNTLVLGATVGIGIVVRAAIIHCNNPIVNCAGELTSSTKPDSSKDLTTRINVLAFEGLAKLVELSQGGIESLAQSNLPEDNGSQSKYDNQVTTTYQAPAGAPITPDDNKRNNTLESKSSIDHIVKNRNGNFISEVNKGATHNIRTVSQQEFRNIKNSLLKNSREVGRYSNGNGTWYELPNGDRFGIRNSTRNGETLDFNVKGLPRDFKIYQK